MATSSKLVLLLLEISFLGDKDPKLKLKHELLEESRGQKPSVVFIEFKVVTCANPTIYFRDNFKFNYNKWRYWTSRLF